MIGMDEEQIRKDKKAFLDAKREEGYEISAEEEEDFMQANYNPELVEKVRLAVYDAGISEWHGDATSGAHTLMGVGEGVLLILNEVMDGNPLGMVEQLEVMTNMIIDRIDDAFESAMKEIAEEDAEKEGSE